VFKGLKLLKKNPGTGV